MNLNTLQEFRHEVYGCFRRAADALFDLSDALLTEPNAHSFVELSQATSARTVNPAANSTKPKRACAAVNDRREAG